MDVLLDGAAADERVDDDRVLLADAVGAVAGLVFHGGVPPAVEVDDVARAGEGESGAGGLEREQEEGRPAGVLELLHQLPALGYGGAAVQHQPGRTEDAGQEIMQRLHHAAVLGEDERGISRGGYLARKVTQACHLTAQGGVIVALAQVLGGVVADLLQVAQDGQQQGESRLRVGLVDDALQALHLAGVETGLLRGEQAEGRLFGLGRQLGQQGGVGFQAAQHEGAHQLAQRAVVRAHLLHHGVELLLRAQQPRGEEVEQAAQLAQRVFHRGAGERHAARRAELQQAARALRIGVLDSLSLVQNQGGQGVLSQQLGAAGGHAVGGERHVRPLQQPLGVLLQVVAVLPVQHIRVQHQRVELRGELAQLVLPVGEQRGRRHDERGAPVERPGGVQMRQPGDDLQGLAQAHVIRQAGAEAGLRHPQQEAHAIHLVGAQGGGQVGGQLWLLRAEAELLQRLLQGRGGHGAHAVLIRRGNIGQGGAVLAEQPAQPSQQGNTACGHAGGLPPAVEQFFELLAVQSHPLAAESDEPVFPRQQLLQLRLAQLVVAQHHAGAEAQQGGDIQRRGAVGFLIVAPGGLQLHLQLHAGRAALPQVHHAGLDAGLLQQGQAFQKIIGLARPPGAGLVNLAAVDELVQESISRCSHLQGAEQRGEGLHIVGIQLAGHGQRRVAGLAILPRAVNESGQKGKGMRLGPLAAILCQVKTQHAQLLPAFAQGGKPLFGRGQFALCLPGQCLSQRAEPLDQHARRHRAAIHRRHALQPVCRLLW